ncbi:MAG: terminase small subunit [Prevotella sp.]|jgi:phage terminase small subunit|nr:terminase small subunit [Prevotella sp.]
MKEKDEKDISEKLSAKEERFCYEYVLHLNATKAAINAGYKENSARVTGCRMLTKANIQNKISALKSNLAETSEISALKILKEHEKIAFSTISDLHNTWIERKDFERLDERQKTCIQEIASKVTRKLSKEFIDGEWKDVPLDVEYVKVKLYDKQKSLDSINRMLGYDAPVRQEITGEISQVTIFEIPDNGRDK